MKIREWQNWSGTPHSYTTIQKISLLECMNEYLIHRLDFLFYKGVLKTSLIFYWFAYYTEILNTHVAEIWKNLRKRT